MPTTEERLTNLEEEVAQIKQLLQEQHKPQNWLDRVLGSMKDYPEFEEVIRLGREFRQSYRPDGDE
jgi:hypothetical protein